LPDFTDTVPDVPTPMTALGSAIANCCRKTGFRRRPHRAVTGNYRVGQGAAGQEPPSVERIEYPLSGRSGEYVAAVL
jgi:hypothetical protein